MDAGDAVHVADVGAELLVGAVVRPLGEEVQVEIGEEELAHGSNLDAASKGTGGGCHSARSRLVVIPSGGRLSFRAKQAKPAQSRNDSRRSARNGLLDVHHYELSGLQIASR